MEKYTLKSWQFTKDLDEDKNALDNHMKAWGVGVLFRTMMSKANPILRIKESKQHPGKYYLISRSQRSGMLVKRFVVGPFEVNGPEIDEKRADGKVFKSKFTLSDDGVLTLTQRHEGDLPLSTTTREIQEDGNMKVVADVAGKVVTRLYVPEDHVESKDDEEL